MKLEQIIGQLFILGFQGDSISENHPIVADLSRRNLGGVILFDRLLAKKREQNNIISATQVKSLTASLQQHSPTPLLIAIDQEGGKVQRLKPKAGFLETLSAEELGEQNDTVLTHIHAACTAATLHHLGINCNLGPVIDLNIFPKNPIIGNLQRSFSSDPACVCDHASSWIKAHRHYNILTSLKHFPGHGSSRTDSHLGFTDISNSWQEEELTPFKTLIQNGFGDSVMLGHLFHEGLDPDFPTSLSPAVVNKLLRKQLRFNGPILTDDMQMKAITDKYGLEEAVCLALAAGVDMIIIGNNLDHDPEILQRLIPSVVQAVRGKKIPETRIHSAWERVKKMKEQLKS